ncbi:MAG: glycosyl hydrolase family 95 catalytic domain-containing protein [Cellulosilyticaceae bacterium]
MNKHRLPKPCHHLRFDTAITRWDEALMLGNGHVGALIWGHSDALSFSLDRCDLWDKTPYPGVLAEDFTYAKLVALAKSRDTDAIRNQFDAPYYNPTPTKLPAGKLCLDFGKDLGVTSELALGNATAQLHIGDCYTVSSYLHATEQSGFIKIVGDASHVRITLQHPEYGKLDDTGAYAYDSQHRELSPGNLKTLHYLAPICHQDETLQYFMQPIDDHFTYGILMMQRTTTTGVEVVYRVFSHPSTDAHWLEEEKRLVQEQLTKGYDACLTTHEAWWANFWNQSAISLPDTFLEKYWYLTNYFLGSASRKGAMPMPLQGVWTADEGMLPPWKGDYHHDLNTEMTYYHYLKSNHLEEGESFIDFLWDLMPQAEAFAKRFYGTDGICLPAVMAIDGTPLGGWPMYSLSPTQQLWLCQAFERHYRFSGDLTFLHEKAFPYIKASATCILGLLEPDENGMLKLPVSSSAEIHDDTADAWLTPNTNYDLALMRYTFTQLIDLANILENGEATHWQSVLDRLPRLMVTPEHVLMLSPDESLQESHRHHAHAMAIHPLRLLDYHVPEHRQIIDATVQDLERLGTDWWVGYSFTWLAEFYAIQGNGDGAATELRRFWEHFCSPNGFHLNGDFRGQGHCKHTYRPFTLEGNFCAADVLQEMLLRTDYGQIELFPAIPTSWQSESFGFEDFRGERGIRISATYTQGATQSIRLTPAHAGTYALRVDAERFLVSPTCPTAMQGDQLLLTLCAHQTYTLTRIH